PRPLDAPEATELEHDATLVLAQHLDGAEEEQREDDQDREKHEHVHERTPGSWMRPAGAGTNGATCRTRPSRASTCSFWPAVTGSVDSACQISPRIRTRPRPV